MTNNKTTSNPIYTLEYDEYEIPKIDDTEVWRYAGYKGIPKEKNLIQFLDEAIQESNGRLIYKVVYTKINKNLFTAKSSDLHKTLNNCEDTYLFAATIGFWIDTQIKKFGKTSSTKSLIYHAIGTERIEALCDKFCENLKIKNYENKQYEDVRFSPGYGDFAMDNQKKIFEILDCEQKLSLSLNESMLISPSKSVTAIVGFQKKSIQKQNKKSCNNKCQNCSTINCEFRKI